MRFIRLFKIFLTFSINSKYRNRILSLIDYHTKVEEPQGHNKEVSNQFTKFKNLKIFLIGGCELTYIKDQLINYGALTKHTFDFGASSTPLMECKNPDSSLYGFNPDIIIMSNVQYLRGVIQKNQLSTIAYELENQLADINSAVSEYRDSIKILQKTLSSKVFVISYPLKYRPTFGLHEYKSFLANLSLVEMIKTYELKLYKLCKEFTHTYFIDVNLILESEGKINTLRDFDADGIYEHFTKEGAFEIIKNLHIQLELLDKNVQRVKCAVFDLDNTLWRGILREDGVGGVEIRENYLNIMQVFASRGILLGLCSKNDAGEEKHIESLLGKKVYDLITIKKINWKPKSQNLKEISKQLNIGENTIAFFDDSPFEREEVKMNAPNIRVFDENQILASLLMPEFIPYGGFNKESIKRIQKYKEQALRVDAEKDYKEDEKSYEEFLKASKLSLTIRRPAEGEISRVAEILQRTNQLNATLKRTELNDLLRYYKDKNNFLILSVFLEDKFGDYGMVGISIIEKSNHIWTLKELAFSCRAMGRKVEHALLVEIMNEAFKSKISSLSMEITITDRNEQILKILEELGFESSQDKIQSNNRILQKYLTKPPPSVGEYANWFKLAS